MKRTSLLLLALLIASLSLSACGPQTVVANAAPPQRLLNVTGSGNVYLKPDVAYINIGVHTELDTASNAVASNGCCTKPLRPSADPAAPGREAEEAGGTLLLWI